MRALVLALLVALVPVRSWAADAMAILMLSSQAVATKSIARNDYSAWTFDEFDAKNDAQAVAKHPPGCPEHLGPSGPTSSTADRDGAACDTCQICHLLAGVPPLATPWTLRVTLKPPQTPANVLVSADPALSLKPPILQV
jgi:hypothetical protein